jgi:hypothetical protein
MAFARTVPVARSHRVGGGSRQRTLPARDVDGYLYADLDAAQRAGQEPL